MRLARQVLLLVPLVAAAASTPMRPLPIPPIPPAHDPAGVPAPVPDRDAAAPEPPQPTGLTIKPRLLRVPTYHNQFDASQGYLNGSRAQEDQADRRLTPSPGLGLAIPLQ